MTPAGSAAPAGEGTGAPAPALPAPPIDRGHHGQIVLRVAVVVGCLAALVAAALLDPAGPGGEPLGLAGFTLPATCSFQAMTGAPCPGCGLTRSWVSAVHGDLWISLRHHTLGWLLLLYALAQAVRHGAWLALPGRRPAIERAGGRLDRSIVVLGVLFFAVWVPRLIAALAP